MGTDSLDSATRHLARGGFVAYPTETVWGLGAAAFSQEAVDRLRAWKGRAEDQPMSILLADVAQLDALAFELSPLARRLIERFWPGALTLVMPCRAPEAFARGIAGPGGGVGVRISSHPRARALARAAMEAGLGPLTTTSLNRAGAPPATNLAAARAAGAASGGAEASLARPLLLGAEGEDASGEPPSTVLDLTRGEPRLLREGALAKDVAAEVARAEAEP